ncbi:MAG: phospholipase D family protein [Rhizobium sp.]|nr:phospholipase D family protein [Rhizobium sp.]
MATKEFILQGFTERSHKDAILELFEVEDIERVLVSVAFVSQNGVYEIEGALAAHGGALTVFAGIRNEITSHQALMRIRNIAGATLYVVDTGSRNILFHPKLYLVRGAKEARLMIGSANLTLGGLNNNVEAGMLIKLEMDNPADKAFVDQIQTQLLDLPARYPEHILHLDDNAKVDALLVTGRVTDETIRPPKSTSPSGATGGTDGVSKIKLKGGFLRPQLKPAIPAAPVPVTVAGPVPAPVVPVSPSNAVELMWQSKPLTERDLNIPTGQKTNKTGSINLDKGLLPEQEDHRPYFRNKVFNALRWTYRLPTVDEAYAQFLFILKGVNYGMFDLAIRHTTSTTSKSYLQSNAMTRLSWGPLKNYVSDTSLLGRTFSLYRDKLDPTKFVIEID